MTKKETFEQVNKQIANWSVLYVKLHHYHWFVTGENFFTLHEKFEELYNEAAKNVDQIAERLLQLGGKPVSTMKQFLDSATLQEAGKEKASREMVEQLVKDFETIKKESQDLTEVLEEAGDNVTADMFVDIREAINLHLWMFKAYLD
ncbi:Dps family protein [Marinicrinis sediminis]|uniref:DNA starvation/stationary phase protection protein n=1 Tax=Marinicrinis sediminis TaxID=1652465 RepID=A0ABW5R9U7_9BACL